MGNLTPIKALHADVPEWVSAMSVAPYQEKVALIVEPRTHPNLVTVIERMAELHPDWLIYLYHGTMNKEFIDADPTLSRLQDEKKLVLFPLQLSNLTASMYNAMFSSTAFWDTVNAKYALVFQTDVCLCDAPNTSFDQFLHYDFVGAPRTIPYVPSLFHFLNGGFSLRNVDAMKRVITECPYVDVAGRIGEDINFSRPCKRAVLKIAPLHVAAQFVTQQGSFHSQEHTPMALHKPWFQFGVKNYDGLETQCPGAKQIARGYGVSRLSTSRFYDACVCRTPKNKNTTYF